MSSKQTNINLQLYRKKELLDIQRVERWLTKLSDDDKAVLAFENGVEGYIKDLKG